MKNSKISTVSSISYTRTEKYIENFEQKNSHQIYTLSLYSYTIETEIHTIYLEDLLDISFKPFSKSGGLLYLHINSGVSTYIIEHDPKVFMNAVKGQLALYKNTSHNKGFNPLA